MATVRVVCVCACVCACTCAFVVVYVQQSAAERPNGQDDDQYDMMRTRISGQFRKTDQRQSRPGH
ncbi:hypothetical protein LY76DRAFT_589515 [Colletotrichum caudatum]|nr:hypothetical protein LY76DRAFT_589515 [Colletotrichum caudatum]